MTAFSRLRPEIRGMLARQKIAEPTPPQEKAIPRILAGEDVLLIAPTGTGKTEAAALPVFHKILRDKARPRGRTAGRGREVGGEERATGEKVREKVRAERTGGQVGEEETVRRGRWRRAAGSPPSTSRRFGPSIGTCSPASKAGARALDHRRRPPRRHHPIREARPVPSAS